LLAHVNADGIHYQASFRGLGLADAAGETYWWQIKEAAWWGNVFDGSGRKSFCTVGNPWTGSWFAGGRGRHCDGGNGNCGMSYAGDCGAVCGPTTADGAYQYCGGTWNVVTTFDQDT